jgi:nitroimidazol reductase NimA-like FMN-containing flavoprotein (pyridoxamine 5'-phosphate oxidase superfamily)
MAASEYPETERNLLRRIPERGSRDRAQVHAILDAGLVCHLGFAGEHGPVVIPTLYARDGETLYLHGSPASRMLRTLARGVPVCATVTHVDGVILARSAFHHSLNFRSAVVFGTARPVEDLTAKAHALHTLVERVVPGRSADSRPPNDYELRFTRVLALEIEEATAKIRTGGPLDEPEDLELPHWAGVIPLRSVAGPAEPAPDLRPGIELPAYAKRWPRARA